MELRGWGRRGGRRVVAGVAEDSCECENVGKSFTVCVNGSCIFPCEYNEGNGEGILLEYKDRS